jgi:hypothetical protein
MRKGTPMHWTPDQLAYMTKRIGEGASTGVLAKEMNKTRNQIVGAVQRHLKPLGVKLQGATLQKDNALERAREARSEAATARREGRLPAPKVVVKIAPVVPVVRVIAQKVAKVEQPIDAPDIDVKLDDLLPLLALTSSACRFPVTVAQGTPGGYLFCAKVRHGESSYCKEHKALCSTQPQRRVTA